MDKLGSNFIQRLALISLIGPISLETACSREGGRDGGGGGGGTSPDDDIFCGEGQDRLRKSVSPGQSASRMCPPGQF